MLTHESLSKEPVRINVASFDYSQDAQKADYNGPSPLQYTYNGTQTFDFNGRPNDADTD